MTQAPEKYDENLLGIAVPFQACGPLGHMTLAHLIQLLEQCKSVERVLAGSGLCIGEDGRLSDGKIDLSVKSQGEDSDRTPTSLDDTVRSIVGNSVREPERERKGSVSAADRTADRLRRTIASGPQTVMIGGKSCPWAAAIPSQAAPAPSTAAAQPIAATWTNGTTLVVDDVGRTLLPNAADAHVDMRPGDRIRVESTAQRIFVAISDGFAAQNELPLTEADRKDQ